MVLPFGRSATLRRAVTCHAQVAITPRRIGLLMSRIRRPCFEACSFKHTSHVRSSRCSTGSTFARAQYTDSARRQGRGASQKTREESFHRRQGKQVHHHLQHPSTPATFSNQRPRTQATESQKPPEDKTQRRKTPHIGRYKFLLLPR